MHRIISIFIIGLVLLAPMRAQTVPDGLVDALARGDARTMAVYFHQSLELTILTKDYMVSKNQATRIMEDFFKEHPPTGFSISFEGAKQKSKYAIGALKTAAQDFRVNIFFLNKEGDRLIYYMSIEKESNYELHP